MSPRPPSMLFGLGLLASVCAAAQTQYTVTPIPAPAGATSFSPEALNNSGQVAGDVSFPTSNPAPACSNRLFVYSGGEFSYASPVTGASDCSGGTGLGSEFETLRAGAFNDQAQAVGTSTSSQVASDGSSLTHAILFSGGVTQDLNATTAGVPPNIVLRGGSALNNTGLVGGMSYDLNVIAYAGQSDPSAIVFYEATSGVFGSLGDAFGENGPGMLPESANALGQLIGAACLDCEPGDIAVWQNGAALDTGIQHDYPARLSDSGSFISTTHSSGQSATGAYTWGFVWTNGVMTPIEPLPGDGGTQGIGLNSAGLAIAMSDSHPILWDATNGTRDLNQILAGTGWTLTGVSAINNGGQILAQGSQNGGAAQPVLVTPVSGATPAGTNTTVTANNATLTFTSVGSGGTTTVASADPSTIGTVPGGFAVSNTVAYQISTTASFSGPVTLAFQVPGPIGQADFDNLRVYHDDNGTLVDITATSPAPDYATLTVYGTTDSFSPFYLVHQGDSVKPLFNPHPAQAGSTIPVRLEVLDGTGRNISSPTLPVTARSVTQLSTGADGKAVASGHANVDGAFRFDGSAYLYNLSTKGLPPGHYVLSCYVGNERNYFYTVNFDLR